ncbi:hypothetical protein [Pseudomonas fluorescens]|uniref:Peptidase inhibitor I78 family protein n=1 Tax=Pseudomonas fluorescens TaxID=294 RepID=A0A423M5H3_PSEFL|nr:hypothetical protein [Pseudomonas fluorescens]RON77217.1 hypothetical protein BK670_26600 [Pseudomonas fluorescens]
MTNEEALQQIRHLIGTRFVPSVVAYIRELTGITTIRAGHVRTTDIRTNRLNINEDPAGNIHSFSFN